MKLLSVIALSSAMLASPAFGQVDNYSLFVGLAAGKSDFLDADSVGRSAGADIDADATGYRVSIGLEGGSVIGGIDYINWGDIEGTYTGGGKFTLNPETFGPWIGYKFIRSGSFTLTPRVGYMISDPVTAIINNAANVKIEADGYIGGVALDYTLSEAITVGIGYDRLEDISMISAGVRFRLN